MSDLNVITCTGRLGQDADPVKYTQGGTAIWTASVGVGYGYGDNKGTNWLRVQVFGKRAESLGKLDLQKGQAVAVSGELRLREYDKKDGGKGWAHEVNAQDVHLLGGRPDTGGGTSRQNAPRPTQRPQRATEPAPAFDDEFSDEIPFASNQGAW